jgi:radical SAM protein with 4Fe4S-binding SPASM domain
MADLAKRAWQDNVLLSVLVELTYKCNLDCFFCYNDRGQQGTPLSKEQYFSLFEELRDMRVLYLILSGGEPLAHPDFFALGAKARELGFVIRIKSNGHALNQRLARRVKEEIDPYAIDISLHGATAEVHDRQTQVPGSFDKLMDNLRVLKTLNLRYKLNGTLTLWNEHQIEAMHELADNLGAPLNVSTAVTPRDDGDTTPLSIAPSRDAIGKSFAVALGRSSSQEDWLSDPTAPVTGKCSAKGDGQKQCGTGSSTLTIDPVGNIVPCVQWRRPVGNVHRDKLKELWHHSADLQDVRQTSIRAREFVESHGKQGRLMRYCIGEAVSQTGSPVGLYPIARRQMDSRLKVLIK